MSLQTFVANVRFASRTGKDTTIGGGIYTAKEMGEAAESIKALQIACNRLQLAAMARDTTMGDQCALFAAQAELRDAAKLAGDAIKLAGGAV